MLSYSVQLTPLLACLLSLHWVLWVGCILCWFGGASGTTSEIPRVCSQESYETLMMAYVLFQTLFLSLLLSLSLSLCLSLCLSLSHSLTFHTHTHVWRRTQTCTHTLRQTHTHTHTYTHTNLSFFSVCRFSLGYDGSLLCARSRGAVVLWENSRWDFHTPGVDLVKAVARESEAALFTGTLAASFSIFPADLQILVQWRDSTPPETQAKGYFLRLIFFLPLWFFFTV